MSVTCIQSCDVQRDQDPAQRPVFARAEDVKDGDVLIADGGFTCLPAGAERVVQMDEDGELYIACDHGWHKLEGQLGYTDETEGLYIGLTLKAPAEAR